MYDVRHRKCIFCVCMAFIYANVYECTKEEFMRMSMIWNRCEQNWNRHLRLPYELYGVARAPVERKNAILITSDIYQNVQALTQNWFYPNTVNTFHLYVCVCVRKFGEWIFSVFEKLILFEVFLSFWRSA